MVRIARLGRMYKLIKLTRLIRIIKIMKQKSNLLKFAADLFQLGNGFERIYFFIIFSLMVCHIFACLWVFFSQLAEAEGLETWMHDEAIKEMNSDE